METLNLFRNIYRWWKGPPPREEVSSAFRFKYTCFKDLLDSNTELLNIIADMEEKLRGRQVFGMTYVRSQSARAAFHAFRMIKSLDVLSGHKYPILYRVLEVINSRIKNRLGQRRELQVAELVLPLSGVNKGMVDWVGGKSANLGEVANRVRLPIPAGFAITTRAFDAFLAHNDLVDEINKRKMELDPQDPSSYLRVSDEIRQLILAAQVPPALEEAMGAAYQQMAAARGQGGPDDLRVSLRSSAIGEDSELSYAGQYLSVLNVGAHQLLQAYKEVVASLYTPRAISYRINKGIRGEDIAMSVACLEMVDAVASGVMYSRHPFNILEDRILISAVWGLGPYAVEGVITPDTYQIAKDEALTMVKTEVPPKTVQLVSNPQGGLMEIPVPPEMQDKPCLSPEQVKALAGYALKLEEHYRTPQDVEWSLDRQGRLLILQTRPLRLQAPAPGDLEAIPPIPGYPLLVDRGAVAAPGVGCGPAFLVREDKDLVQVPDGAVLVAKHSSPKFVVAMTKAQAIIADFGSISGHMASLSREFGVPTLLDTRVATSVITPGMEITVDAYTGRVYQGRVPELLARRQTRESHMEDTPVYQTLKQAAEHIVPLRLVDPRSPEFDPEHCRSLHDLGRLVHEFSYNEMFKISDLVSDRGEGALKLAAPIPLDLYLIDLDWGLTGVKKDAWKVTPENINCVPLKALLKGLMHPDLQARGPRPVQFSGLMSVMREQLLAGPNPEERFGDRSFAIISDKYLNFSSRVGYHYSVLDAYCGQTVNKNYITFSFKGGAADDVRRNRRVRAIAIALMGLDFSVDVKGDRVDARLMKYECPVIEEKMDQIGRLLNFTRQMDMLMTAEVSVEALARNFLEGNYSLEFLETPTG
ncbi:MAG: phosphoenolpyruvate synthase [Deltaproteobacteria bacterium]|nr:phosphoenolpyruvate synthase [Deltaproteobacteria bacterium]